MIQKTNSIEIRCHHLYKIISTTVGFKIFQKANENRLLDQQLLYIISFDLQADL